MNLCLFETNSICKRKQGSCYLDKVENAFNSSIQRERTHAFAYLGLVQLKTSKSSQ
jgi:hypothetical protein